MHAWRFIVVLLLLLVGCGQADTPDATQLADAGATAFEAVETFEFDLQVTDGTSAPINDISIISAVGQTERPEKLQADLKARLAGAPIAVNIKAIIIGEEAWVTPNPFNVQQWEQVEGTEGLAAFSPAQGVSDVLRGMRELEYVGAEEINGIATHHIRGIADTSTLNAITGGVATAGEVTVDLWLGQDDTLLRKLSAVGALDPAEEPEITRTILIDNFNTAVDINAP